jgi:thioredoxin 1
MKWIREEWRMVIVIGILATFASALAAAPTRQPTTPVKKRGDDVMSTSTQAVGTVQYADEDNFLETVLESEVPVLVDFYADWCGPCKMIAPVLDEVASEMPDARIVKVNVDHSPRLAARYGVSSIPSLKAFKDGEIVEEHVGLANKARLKSMLSM